MTVKYVRRLEAQLAVIFSDLPSVVTGTTSAVLYSKAREVAYKKMLAHIKSEEQKISDTCEKFSNNIERLIKVDT